jgi:hypothetical protein
MKRRFKNEKSGTEKLELRSKYLTVIIFSEKAPDGELFLFLGLVCIMHDSIPVNGTG